MKKMEVVRRMVFVTEHCHLKMRTRHLHNPAVAAASLHSHTKCHSYIPSTSQPKRLETFKSITMCSNPQPFFTHLPYDIRVIIYNYLEPSKVPPFSPRFNTALRLTCHQALEEIDDKPKKEIAKYITEFKAKTEVDLTITSDPCDLHNIAVTIPFAAINTSVRHGHQKNYVGWKLEYKNALHPLFALNFNTVRVHIGSEDDKDAPDHATLLDRGRVDVCMHSLVRGLVHGIERRNEIDFASQEAEGAASTTAVRPPDRDDLSSQVRARQICLSWDLRDDRSEKNVVLNGQLHQSRNLGRQSYTAEAMARRQRLFRDEASQASEESLELAQLPRTVFYHVRDAQRLMGLMCIQSSCRWATCEDGFFLNEAINTQECTTEYVSCAGLDGHLVRGLTALDQDTYEDEEREVEEVLWAT